MAEDAESMARKCGEASARGEKSEDVLAKAKEGASRARGALKVLVAEVRKEWPNKGDLLNAYAARATTAGFRPSNVNRGAQYFKKLFTEGLKKNGGKSTFSDMHANNLCKKFLNEVYPEDAAGKVPRDVRPPTVKAAAGGGESIAKKRKAAEAGPSSVKPAHPVPGNENKPNSAHPKRKKAATSPAEDEDEDDGDPRDGGGGGRDDEGVRWCVRPDAETRLATLSDRFTKAIGPALTPAAAAWAQEGANAEEQLESAEGAVAMRQRECYQGVVTVREEVMFPSIVEGVGGRVTTRYDSEVRAALGGARLVYVDRAQEEKRVKAVVIPGPPISVMVVCSDFINGFEILDLEAKSEAVGTALIGLVLKLARGNETCRVRAEVAAKNKVWWLKLGFEPGPQGFLERPGNDDARYVVYGPEHTMNRILVRNVDDAGSRQIRNNPEESNGYNAEYVKRLMTKVEVHLPCDCDVLKAARLDTEQAEKVKAGAKGKAQEYHTDISPSLARAMRVYVGLFNTSEEICTVDIGRDRVEVLPQASVHFHAAMVHRGTEQLHRGRVYVLYSKKKLTAEEKAEVLKAAGDLIFPGNALPVYIREDAKN